MTKIASFWITREAFEHTIIPTRPSEPLRPEFERNRAFESTIRKLEQKIDMVKKNAVVIWVEGKSDDILGERVVVSAYYDFDDQYPIRQIAYGLCKRVLEAMQFGRKQPEILADWSESADE